MQLSADTGRTSSERQGEHGRGGQSGSRSTPHTSHIAQHTVPFANQLLECKPVTQGWKDSAHRPAWPGKKNMKGGLIR